MKSFMGFRWILLQFPITPLILVTQQERVGCVHLDSAILSLVGIQYYFPELIVRFVSKSYRLHITYNSIIRYLVVARVYITTGWLLRASCMAKYRQGIENGLKRNV